MTEEKRLECGEGDWWNGFGNNHGVLALLYGVFSSNYDTVGHAMQVASFLVIAWVVESVYGTRILNTPKCAVFWVSRDITWCFGYCSINFQALGGSLRLGKYNINTLFHLIGLIFFGYISDVRCMLINLFSLH